MFFPRNRPKRKPRVQKGQSKKITRSISSTISGQELCHIDSGIASSQEIDKPLTGSQCSTTSTLDSQHSDVSTMIMRRPTSSQSLERDEVDSVLASKEYDSDDSFSPDSVSFTYNKKTLDT